MLAKFSIILRFLEDGKIRGRGGEAVHGFIINEVASISEKYAEYLHNMKGIKPFSLSPVLPEKGDWELKEGYLNINGNAEARIIISALNDETTGILIKALIDAKKQEKMVNIGELKAKVERVYIKERDGARFERYSNIIKRAKRNRKVMFRFLTPTSFRQNGTQMTFPTPDLVFSSLLQIWNTFSDIKIPEEIKEKFKSIAVSRYNLHSELWHFSRYKIFGCKGSIEYIFKNGFTDAELKLLNALCLFSEFSGVGYKRTMGMGMVEVDFMK